jgi:lysophospholipase L1-like esterase
MKQAGVPINDLHSVVESGGSDRLMLADGTHYTEEGYEALAAAVSETILRSLVSGP